MQLEASYHAPRQARHGRAIVFHVDQGRGLQPSRAITRHTSMWWTEGYAGSVVGCVWEAEGRAGASIVKWLAVAAACGCQPVAAALPNLSAVANKILSLTGERRARRPGIVFAVHRSRLTGRLAHLSLLPSLFPSAPDAGQPGGDWRLVIRSSRASLNSFHTLVVAKACSTLVGTDQEIVSPHARVTSNRHRHRDFFRKIDRNRSKQALTQS